MIYAVRRGMALAEWLTKPRGDERALKRDA
jgi:hypothetical protein